MAKKSWFKADWQRKRELDAYISQSDWQAVLSDIKSNDAGEGGLVTFVNPFSYLQVLDSSFDLSQFRFLVDGQKISKSFGRQTAKDCSI